MNRRIAQGNTRGTGTIPLERISSAIFILRGHRVILDAELAALYGVTTKALNQAIKRNRDRFPDDFLVQLNPRELSALNRSQFVTGSQKHRDPRFPPRAFTEHGAIMAAAVLNSPLAVEMSVFVVRAFVKLGVVESALLLIPSRLNLVRFNPGPGRLTGEKRWLVKTGAPPCALSNAIIVVHPRGSVVVVVERQETGRSSASLSRHTCNSGPGHANHTAGSAHAPRVVVPSATPRNTPPYRRSSADGHRPAG